MLKVSTEILTQLDIVNLQFRGNSSHRESHKDQGSIQKYYNPGWLGHQCRSDVHQGTCTCQKAGNGLA